MIFHATAIAGAFEIEPEMLADERGVFARTFCAALFAERGLVTHWPQCNVSTNPRRGTLRGMHWQAEPHGEAKLVRATRGLVYDVALDLRPGSPSFRNWAAVELDERRANAFYIPSGCAHGFLTLEDDSALFYQMSTPYVPGAARCLRWDDPAFTIDWPSPPALIGARDAACPDFTEEVTP